MLKFANGNVVAGVVPLTKRLFAVVKGESNLATYGRISFADARAVRLFGGDKSLSEIAPQSLTISENGRTLAWWARPGKDGTEWFCYVDAKRIAGSLDVDPYDDRIALSPDGTRVAFRLKRREGEGKSRKTVAAYAYIDGKPGKEYRWIGGFVFSSDSIKCAYWAQKNDSQNYIYVVQGNQVGKEWDDVDALCFSRNNQSWAHFSKRGKVNHLICGEQEVVLPHDTVWGFAALGLHNYRFFARKNNNVFIVEATAESRD